MKRLRAKMIVVVFLCVMLVFTLTLVILQFSLVKYNIKQADGMTQLISISNGVVPEMQEFEDSARIELLNQIVFNAESAFRTRYFVVYFNEETEIAGTNVEHIASIDENTAREMAKSVVGGNDTVGYFNEYRFRIAADNDGNLFVIFLDCSENFASRRLAVTILTLSLIAFSVLITVLFAVFSKRIFKPFEENARRQKQFITDASHELKTPLAIISANAEVLTYKDGGNEWLNNITEQAGRMGDLINELLTLSKMEELHEGVKPEPVRLDELVAGTVESFHEVFLQKQVAVQTRIDPDAIVHGDRKQLSMLISILVENASKYVTESGKIRVSLKKFSKYVSFQIYNTAKVERDLNPQLLFERFYRPDSARASDSGGHGIGLSIAKRIVQLHNGSISAKRVDEGICFTAEISGRMKGRKNGLFFFKHL